MPAQFEDSGIRFQYPDNWRLEREDNETGWTVAVQSPATAFMMICLREDMPTTDDLADTALAALREDYPSLEAEDCFDTLAGQPAIGHDIQFLSLDLTNTCWTRSFYSTYGTVLVLCQTNDLEGNEAVLRAICASIEVEDD
jgi:hypothetical protein